MHPRHSWRYTARLRECNLKLQQVWCHFLNQSCDFLCVCVCYKTHDGTWHDYISIVFVTTREGSQYFQYYLLVCVREIRIRIVYMLCMMIPLVLFVYFWFPTIRGKSDRDAYTSELFLQVCVRRALIVNVLELGSILVISLSPTRSPRADFDLCGLFRLKLGLTRCLYDSSFIVFSLKRWEWSMPLY